MFAAIGMIGDNCTTDTDCTSAFENSTCSMNQCACVDGFQEVVSENTSQCVESESDTLDYMQLVLHQGRIQGIRKGAPDICLSSFL